MQIVGCLFLVLLGALAVTGVFCCHGTLAFDLFFFFYRKQYLVVRDQCGNKDQANNTNKKDTHKKLTVSTSSESEGSSKTP